MQTRKQFTLLDSDPEPDDIDILFSHLQPIEPPPTLTERILSQLPARLASVSLSLQPMAVLKLDTWSVQNKKSKLC